MASAGKEYPDVSGDHCDQVLALVSNIPAGFHSKDLRRFFSTFVEKGRFLCFHYRHRPQHPANEHAADVSSNKSRRVPGCCLVRISGTKKDRSEFIVTYDGVNWTNESGGILPSVCKISPARLADGEPLPMELKPPIAMPRGNVGTQTQYFLDAIKSCRLPASVIGKLGLVFARRGARRIYSNVPPPITNADDDEDDEEDKTCREGNEDADGKNKPDHQGSDDDEPAEEWDRHEAQYDDVTDQERTKERLYEEDMEVVWEKGGPGLVFYTDSYYWDQQETDTDAKWADDWDVDTNVYTDPNDADKDAKDSVAMRRESMLRSGQLTESVFKKPQQPVPSSSSPHEWRIGKKRRLEMGKGGKSTAMSDFGRKVMEKHGWKPGTGLGAASSGKVGIVHDELQEASRVGFADKRGFGYFGERLNRKPLKRRTETPLITTIYDNPAFTDPPEPLLSRHEPTWTKHRR